MVGFVIIPRGILYMFFYKFYGVINHYENFYVVICQQCDVTMFLTLPPFFKDPSFLANLSPLGNLSYVC